MEAGWGAGGSNRDCWLTSRTGQRWWNKAVVVAGRPLGVREGAELITGPARPKLHGSGRSVIAAVGNPAALAGIRRPSTQFVEALSAFEVRGKPRAVRHGHPAKRGSPTKSHPG